MSVRPSSRPHGTTRLLLEGFSLTSIFEYFSKICRENSSLIKTWKRRTRTLHEELSAFMLIFSWILHRMRNVLDKFVQKNKTHFISWGIKKPTWCHLLFFFHLIFAQHVSNINMSIFRSLRLCWWITTSVILFSFRCVLGFAADDVWWCPFCRVEALWTY